MFPFLPALQVGGNTSFLSFFFGLFVCLLVSFPLPALQMGAIRERHLLVFYHPPFPCFPNYYDQDISGWFNQIMIGLCFTGNFVC